MVLQRLLILTLVGPFLSHLSKRLWIVFVFFVQRGIQFDFMWAKWLVLFSFRFFSLGLQDV